eukprot:14081952-Alexandrium_andersonii.AAC.1
MPLSVQAFMDASLSGVGAGTAPAAIENVGSAGAADDVAGADKEFRTEGAFKVRRAALVFVFGHWGGCPLQATIGPRCVAYKN